MKKNKKLRQKSKIIDVMNRLFIATDELDWQAVQACFAPEVLFDMSSPAGGKAEIRTPEQITATWDEGLRHLKAVHHQVGNHVVKLTDDGAEAFCYGIASHYLPNPTGRNTRQFVGSYDFHFTKVEGRWVIDRFRFQLKYIDGNERLEVEG